jgi:2,3-bisphosphoglycerate-independent phosphoglycerate mutase
MKAADGCVSRRIQGIKSDMEEFREQFRLSEAKAVETEIFRTVAETVDAQLIDVKTKCDAVMSLAAEAFSVSNMQKLHRDMTDEMVNQFLLRLREQTVSDSLGSVMTAVDTRVDERLRDKFLVTLESKIGRDELSEY